MGNFDRAFRPDLPESQSGSLQDGIISGWVPAIITSLKDDEGLGRIRISVDLIQPGANMPNGDDGYCWVGEDFTCNSGPGGSHRFLQEGTLIAALPMMGNPNQFLLLHCLNNRVDRPHPEFNRDQQTYGSATPGQVFTVKNDTDGSRTDSYPHGVLQNVSGKGTLTYQTRDHARLQLTADGASRLENDYSFTMHTPDGTVAQRSANGAQSVLKAGGNVVINSSAAAALRLLQGDAKMIGPQDPISTAIGLVQSLLGGNLGLSGGLLTQLGGLAAQMGMGGDLASFLGPATQVLGQLQSGLGQGVPGGLAALGTLQGAGFARLGAVLMPQAQAILGAGFASFVPQLETFLGQTPRFLPGDLSQQLGSIIPANLLQDLDLGKLSETLAPILDALSHDRPLQLQNILEQILPDGFESVQNLVGMNVHTIIEPVQDLLSQELPTLDSLLEAGQIVLELGMELGAPEHLALLAQAIEQELKRRTNEIQTLIPQDLKPFVTEADLRELLLLPKTAENLPLELLMGQFSSGLITQAKQQVEQIAPQVQQIAPVADLAQKLLANDPAVLNQQFLQQQLQDLGQQFPGISSIINARGAANLQQHLSETVLPAAVQSLSESLQPLLGPTVEQLNKAINAVPANLFGATVRATATKSEIFTNLKEAGSKIVVDFPMAQLQAPFNLTRVYASKAAAGVKTPYGGFDIGGAGSLLNTLGSLGMRVAQKALFANGKGQDATHGSGESAGMQAHPTKGAAIASFFAQDWQLNDSANGWSQRSAEIRAQRQTAQMTAYSKEQEILHRLEVDRTGLFFNRVWDGIHPNGKITKHEIEFANAAQLRFRLDPQSIGLHSPRSLLGLSPNGKTRLFSRDYISCRTGAAETSTSAGLFLDPIEGASLIAYPAAPQWNWDSPTLKDPYKTAEVNVQDSTIRLTAFLLPPPPPPPPPIVGPLPAGEATAPAPLPLPVIAQQLAITPDAIVFASYANGTLAHRLRIGPNGIFANDRDLNAPPAPDPALGETQATVTQLQSTLAALEQRIAVLEAGAGP